MMKVSKRKLILPNKSERNVIRFSRRNRVIGIKRFIHRQLQLQMKQLTPEKKKTLGKQIQRKIAGLREDNARAKADFQKKYIEFA